MANSDVKVKEVRLLESYYTAYNRFMESTIALTYRFRNLFSQKDDKAKDLKRKIENHLNIAQQKYAHAKNEYEASLKRRANKQEIEQRERDMQMYKEIFEKAKKYTESAKKLYQKIHGETNRVIWMNERQRNKLERSKEEGNNFLNKAIAALNEYKQ